MSVPNELMRGTRSALRLLVSAFLALVVAFGSLGSVRAQEMGPSSPAPSSHAAHAAESSTSALPSDVPAVGPGEVTIPSIPTTYRTRDVDGWMKVAYPPSAEERVASMLTDVGAFKAEVERVLGQRVLDHVEVRIAPTFSDMARLAPLEAPPPSYASGVAYPRLRYVLISMLAPRGAEATDLDAVLRHELVHIALEDAVLGRHVPAWFNEGLAVGLAGENSFERQKVLWSATVSGKLVPLAELDRGFPSDHSDVSVAYAESASFLLFLRQQSDLARFASTIDRVREGQPFERAIADAYGSDLRKLEFQWRSAIERRYSVIPVLAGGGILWVAVIGALGWGYVKKRRRAKAILAKWAEEEAIEDALIARRAAETEATERELPRSLHGLRAQPKVEHDGHWHTLH